MDTLRRVLEGEPEHAAARSLLTSLEGKDLPRPPRRQSKMSRLSVRRRAHRRVRRRAFASTSPKATRTSRSCSTTSRSRIGHHVDECVAIPVDPTTMFVYWEMRESTRAHL